VCSGGYPVRGAARFYPPIKSVDGRACTAEQSQPAGFDLAGLELRLKLNFVEWADLSCEEVRGASQLLGRITESNGCRVASDRMSALAEEMDPLAEAIVEAEASTLGGLRAKALVVLWEARPSSSSHEGAFEFPDDGGASRSLFDVVALLTGLTTMVREVEVRLAADVSDECTDG
jgi:hypothetical protein